MKQRKNQGRTSFKATLKRYSISILAIALASAIFAGILTAHYMQTDAQIRKDQASIQAMKRTLAQMLLDIQARKAAQAARQDAEAKELAAQSIDGSSELSQLDSRRCNPSKLYSDPASIDVVVNKKHCLQPLTFEPVDLITSNGATLSAKAVDAYNQMFVAASAAGQPFYTTSSYRSHQSQISTYAHWVAVSGAAVADTYSARPGYSEHQTGLAFDVAANGCALDCFGSTTQYQWLQDNAAAFGFIQRYYAGKESITGYKAEEWHYRYVGVTTATDMRVKGVKTLEEYRGMAGGDY